MDKQNPRADYRKPIIHLTSVHPPRDVRIFYKECVSLSRNGYHVILVAPGETNETVQGISIQNIPRVTNRIKRILFSPFRILLKALWTRSSVYHIHDPELIPVGLLLRLLGKKVIYDVHENVIAQIKNKVWLPFPGVFSCFYAAVDWIAAKAFYLILAENSYKSLYSRHTTRAISVLNMPDLNFFDQLNDPGRPMNNNLFYIGLVNKHRGILEVINALSLLKEQGFLFNYHCVGKIVDGVEEDIEKLESYSKVKSRIKFYGYRDFRDGYQISKNCSVGICLLEPIANYEHSYPTKMFEYMAISMPIIASNFKLHKEVVERNDCGLCVDSTNPSAIAQNILWLYQHPERAAEMGKNGRKKVEECFNWQNEEIKLLSVYKYLLKDT